MARASLSIKGSGGWAQEGEPLAGTPEFFRIEGISGSFLLLAKGIALLTEQEVSRSWRKLFVKTEITADTFVKAEALLDELRAESPLRHRLSSELAELRHIHVSEPVS